MNNAVRKNGRKPGDLLEDLSDFTEAERQELAEDEEFNRSLDGSNFSEFAVKVPTGHKIGRPKIGDKITIILNPELIERLKTVSASRGIGYQTMIRMMLVEKIADYEKP